MSVPRANAEAACALCAELASSVRHAVVSPGSRNTPLVLALDAQPEIQTHVAIDERTAGFLALGLARSSGSPVVLSCTSGSAGAHYLPAIIEAYESGAPLVVLTADRPPELHGFAAPQTTQQNGFFSNHVALQVALPPPDESEPEAFAEIGRRALTVAETEARPVHINAAFREPLWDPSIPQAAARQPASQGSSRTPPSASSELRVALPTVTTPRGVIIAGPRDRQDRLRDEPALARLCHSVAAKLGWPVLADITGGMRYHEGRPAITGYDSFLRSEATAERLHPECALLLGRPLTSKTTNQWLLERQIPVVVAGETPTHRDPRLNNVIEVRGGLREILERLNEAIDTTTSAPGWLELWHDAESAFLDRNREDSQWWEGAIARAAVRGLPAGALLHLSSSMPVRDADGFSGPLDRAVTVTSNRGVNGIDGVIATAAGQALAWKHGPSAVLIGDVAFLHDLGSLRHAVGANLNLTVIVVNNGGGRIFDFLPIHRHPTAFETFFRTDQRAEIEPIATGLGAAYSSVARVDELSEALAQATKAPGVNVIEAVTDGTHNRATHEQFHQSVLEALP